MSTDMDDWKPNRSLLSPSDQPRSFIREPELHRIRIYISNPESPPFKENQLFEYCGALCLDVPLDATSLQEYAIRLRSTTKGEARQKVLLLSGPTTQLQYGSESEILSCFDVGNRDKLLAALCRGRERAKRYAQIRSEEEVDKDLTEYFNKKKRRYKRGS